MDMEVITCKSCGKIFNYISGSRVCPQCVKKMDEKFVEVKKYVYDHPKIGIDELAEEMDVSIRQIKRWVKEERLCFSEDSPVGIECENCGTLIKTGRFCKECKGKLSNGLKDAAGMNRPVAAAPVKKGSKENKMRFLD